MIAFKTEIITSYVWSVFFSHNSLSAVLSELSLIDRLERVIVSTGLIRVLVLFHCADLATYTVGTFPRPEKKLIYNWKSQWLPLFITVREKGRGEERGSMF